MNDSKVVSAMKHTISILEFIRLLRSPGLNDIQERFEKIVEDGMPRLSAEELKEIIRYKRFVDEMTYGASTNKEPDIVNNFTSKMSNN